ncbi:membrane protein [hydrothermal vent metagenome]|uniref:Membrane protein n=1 Tax=hydrothermal vent metagenome TaxID=652676 RepID=A0A1W1BJL1_9ZZZZ
MSNNNLDDLIVDEIPEKSKGKGLLAVFALLVAVLIVAIIMTRMILNGDEENSTVVKEPNQEDMISSELQFKPSTHDQKADKEELDQLSSILEDELVNKPPKNANSSSAIVKRRDADRDIKPDTATISGDDVAKSQTEEPSNIDKDTATNHNRESYSSAKKATQPEKTPKKPVVQQPQRREPVAASRPAVAKPSSKGNYYVQVGSFANKPSQQFLSIISKSGFRYKLKAGKLLIGPYSSRAAAQSNLPKIKDRISKGAFIKKL